MSLYWSRTCTEVPKAREESARIFKSYLSAPHTMQRAVEVEREKRKVERNLEIEKTLQCIIPNKQFDFDFIHTIHTFS